MTGTNCFHVQSDSEGNGTNFTNRPNDAAVKNMIGEGREVIRYNSGQVKPKPKLQFLVFFITIEALPSIQELP